ncbi:MAG: acyl carrier protein [Xanthobacteraceae bacterium]
MGSMRQLPSRGADSDIRAFLANHFHVDVGRVTDDAHLRNDLGADWLDRLELLILIEDNFDDIELPDDADRIEVVGDLIRQVEHALTQRCGTSG